MSTVGERLKMLRGDRPQIQVATELMISDSALSAYETGERTPRDDVKKRIAKYYGKKVQDIFFDEE